MPEAPLILTLKIDADSQLFFNRLRRQYFPPERNYLDAHLTLFHHLPARSGQILEDIEVEAKLHQHMQLKVIEIKSIGNGVAYKVECAELLQLHKHMQTQWHEWLIPQDKQRLWPHITIQNKVEPAKALQLLAQLQQGFEPFSICGVGLSLFEYKGGPWEFVRAIDFTGKDI